MASSFWRSHFNFWSATQSRKLTSSEIYLKHQNIGVQTSVCFSMVHLFSQESNTNKVDGYLKNYTSKRPLGINIGIAGALFENKSLGLETCVRMLAWNQHKLCKQYSPFISTSFTLNVFAKSQYFLRKKKRFCNWFNLHIANSTPTVVGIIFLQGPEAAENPINPIIIFFHCRLW